MLNKGINTDPAPSGLPPGCNYEFSYFEEKLGVCCDQIRLAIAKVGNIREDIEAYLLLNIDPGYN